MQSTPTDPRTAPLRSRDPRDILTVVDPSSTDPTAVPLRSLDPRDILTVLDLTSPELAAARDCAAAGDRIGVLQQLLQRCRERFPLEPIPAEGAQEAIAEAEQTLQHIFQWGPYEAAQYSDPIDWAWDPRGDIEWVAAIYRFYWADALAKAYAATGDNRYARGFVELAADWIAKHPLETHARTHPVYTSWKGFAWLDIQTGIRATRICSAFRTLVHSPDFTPAFLGILLASMYDHQVKTERLPMNMVHNKAVFEQRGFINVAAAFPEFRDSRRWIELGLARTRENLLAQTTSDGVQREWSFGYHLGVLRDADEIMDRAIAAGIALPEDYKERVRRMHEYIFWVATPDLGAPMFGDASRPREPACQRSQGPLYDYLISASDRTGDPRFAARATLTGDCLPAHASHAFPEAGMYILRNTWQPDAIHLGLHCSPRAISSHDHPDNGTFELFAFGRCLMPDSGFYTYGHDPEARQWHRQTAVHQTLTLDGRDSAVEGRHLLWVSAAECDTVTVENAAYPGLVHRRTIWFIDKAFFVIFDEAIGHAAGDLDLHFQFAPGELRLDHSKQQAVTTFASANLLLCCHSNQPLTMTPEQGWYGWAYGHRVPREALRVRHPSPAPAGFVSLLVPYRDSTPPLVEVNPPAALPLGADKVELSVTVSGRQRVVGREISSGTAWVRDCPA